MERRGGEGKFRGKKSRKFQASQGGAGCNERKRDTSNYPKRGKAWKESAGQAQSGTNLGGGEALCQGGPCRGGSSSQRGKKGSPLAGEIGCRLGKGGKKTFFGEQSLYEKEESLGGKERGIRSKREFGINREERMSVKEKKGGRISLFWGQRKKKEKAMLSGKKKCGDN